MTGTQRRAILGLLAVHVVLSPAPLAAGLLFGDSNNIEMLPFVWALQSVFLSQVMLVSIWVGMPKTGRILPKILFAILATAFLAVWITSGEVLGSREKPISIVSLYFQNLAIMLGFVAVLSLGMFGTSGLVGTVRFTGDTNLPSTEPRFHYSLFALLAVSTATAVVLGLVRVAREDEASEQSQMVVDYVLAVVVFALNILATIWATLGAGHVNRRLLVVLVVSILLGFFITMATGNSPFQEPWWLFFFGPLIVIVPTVIVACSLLWMRRIGYRLVASQTKLGHDSDNPKELQSDA